MMLMRSLALLFACLSLTLCLHDGVGYRIGNASDFKLLKSFQKSKLYQVECAQLDDQRPIKLVELVGSHYEVGYAYAALLGPEIVETYHTFFTAEFSAQWEIVLLQQFLTWQYDQFVSKEIPREFKQELKGLQDGGAKQHSIKNLKMMFEQTLVVSSYPGDFGTDIIYTLFDQFMRSYLVFQDEALLNIVESKIFYCVKLIQSFLNRKKIHCSFFAIWGNRTEGGRLATMRNLDWEPNTGTNKHKTVFVWKVDNTIPHLTLGFPGIMGALTGMSKAGLTVHEAGIDSMRATEVGFQWTLRLRYVMMHASNLREARQIWQSTNNTLGMNHMIASASDLVTDHPAMVMETMRNYTAFFQDNDERQRNTIFVDPSTKQKFQAGFAMKQAVFRTNHAYDPKINQYRTEKLKVSSSTFKRYTVLKNGIKYYEDAGRRVFKLDAVNITAATAHKGGNDPYRCPGDGDNGTNVLSVVYFPATMEMYTAFEYSGEKTYRTACCGVYVYFNMSRWFE